MREHKITVGAFVPNRKGEFILVEEDTGRLNLPSGTLEDETVPKCGKREFKEETGLIIVLDYVIGIYQNHNRNGRNALKIFYKGHPVGGELDDHMNAGYYDRWHFSRIPERKLHDPVVRTVVADFYRGKRYPLDIIKQYV